MKAENLTISFFAHSIKRSIILFCLLILPFTNQYGTPKTSSPDRRGLDSLIQSLINEVNPDSLKSTIQSLQDFGTRFLAAPNRFTVANWIKKKFISYGLSNVQEDSFQVYSILRYIYPSKSDTTTWQKTIMAELKGSKNPDDIIVIGGHYDDFTKSAELLTNAPGADDNASGTAGVLEIARILLQRGFHPERTIIFAAFPAEELMYYGGSGAKNFAIKLARSGKKIKAMVNLDMIAYSKASPMDSSYQFTVTDLDQGKLNSHITVIKSFLKSQPAAEITKITTSDALPFSDNGIPTFYYMEETQSPNYHGPNDVLSNCNMSYCSELVKSATILLSNLAMMPDTLSSIVLLNHGDNKTLTVKWTKPKDNNIVSYKIYLGSESFKYDKTLFTQDTSLVISDLTGTVKYFIAVSAVNSFGFESYAIERACIPQTGPLAPLNFRDEPKIGKIELAWSRNADDKLQGYNIYRSDSIQGAFLKLGSLTKQDTSFIDETVKKGSYYYYIIKSFDNAGHESIDNNIVRSRALSLDQGVLVLDDTNDGNGGKTSPSDQQVDDFYDYLLKGFNYKAYDLNKEKTIKLADLGAFSTIILHKDDNEVDGPYPFIDDLRKYLDYGGNLILSGYYPSRRFIQYKTLLNDFYPGSFMYDYLKIKLSEYKEECIFNGASSNKQGFELMIREQTKSFPAGVESIEPVDSSLLLFRYYSLSSPTSPFGRMSNMPVGVGYFGNNYKTVTLSFPLYYLMKDQARVFIQNLLINKFGELTEVSFNHKQLPSYNNLEQNYPNPFNPTTTISYSLAKHSHVELKIFDVLGREIINLVDKELTPGKYNIQFNASSLPSGVYIYRLEAGEFTSSKKLLFLK